MARGKSNLLIATASTVEKGRHADADARPIHCPCHPPRSVFAVVMLPSLNPLDHN